MPSMIRSRGSSAPHRPASVGYRSIDATSSSLVRPGATWPGQRTMHGTRRPPSHVVPFAPRSGALLPPSRPREPLSLVNTTMVDSSSPTRAQFVQDDGGDPVDGLDRSSVGAVARGVCEAILYVDRQVHVHVREVQEERLTSRAADEAKRLGEEANGERHLVGLLLHHLVVEQQRQRWVPTLIATFVGRRADLASHVVAVRQPEELVEAMVHRHQPGLVAAMPLPDHRRSVAGVGQEAGQADLRRRQPDRLAGEQHRQPVEVAEPDPRRIAAGQERSP